MTKNPDISFFLVNKRFPKKPIHTVIKVGIDIYNVKRTMLVFFAKDVKPTITDFRLVREGPPEDEEEDTLDENYLDEKYNNTDAYKLFKRIVDKIKTKEGKLPLIYFRTIQSKISMTFYGETKFKISLPLKYENNKYKDLIDNAKQYTKYEILHVFQNTNNYETISEDEDMKIYAKNGIILFLFPIQANLVYKSTNLETNVLLKFDKPLTEYLSESIYKKLKLTSTDILFKIKNNNSFEDLDGNVPIHEILKTTKKEPIIIEIIDMKLNKIPISIPLQHSCNTTINFEYKDEKMKINDLIELIKQYFGINKNDTSFKLYLEDAVISKDKLIKDYSKRKTPLVLKYDQSIELKMNRKFKIKQKEEEKEIEPNQKVKSVLKEIAKENDSHYSLVMLKLDKQILKPDLNFSNYFIPPNKQILVEINDFTEFVKLSIKEKKTEIEFGFTPEMNIKSLTNMKKYKTEILGKLQNKPVFFFNNEKLDEEKTFNKYGIKNNDTIQVVTGKCYVFNYGDDSHTIYDSNELKNISKTLQNHFNLKQGQFLIYQNGKHITEENISKCPNGTEFELKQPVKMKFKVNKECKIDAYSTDQVKDIIKKFSEKRQIKSDSIWLLNENDKPLSPEDYLFDLFDEEDDQVHNLKSENATKYTFQNKEGKFFSEYFLPSMKISTVLVELKKKGKKFEDDSFIIYMDRIADLTSTLSTIVGNKTEEDDEVLNIENEMPDLITITLKFKIGSDDKNINNKFVKGALAYNVHYFASQLIQKDIESITLEVNDELLNDEEAIDEDTEIIVDLSEEDDDPKSLNETLKRINENDDEESIFRTQRIIQKKKAAETSDDSDVLEDFDDDDDEENIFEKGNGTYRASENDPENEYIFKFKMIGGKDFELQLPKDVSVEDVIEKISEDRDVGTENITIFMGNQRLADFKLTNLNVPKKVNYFSVKIIDLQNTIICTRAKMK